MFENRFTPPRRYRRTFSLGLCLILLLPLFLITEIANAGTVAVFEIRKSLPLDPTEPAVRDFYVNGGVESGLKRGIYLNVIRPMAIQDPAKNKTQGTLHVVVAKVQIVQSERGIAVAREVIQVAPEDRPAVDFEGVMVGDELDLESITMEAPKLKARRKSPEQAALEAMTTVRVAERDVIVPLSAPAAPAPLRNSVAESENTSKSARAPDMVKAPATEANAKSASGVSGALGSAGANASKTSDEKTSTKMVSQDVPSGSSKSSPKDAPKESGRDNVATAPKESKLDTKLEGKTQAN